MDWGIFIGEKEIKNYNKFYNKYNIEYKVVYNLYWIWG